MTPGRIGENAQEGQLKASNMRWYTPMKKEEKELLQEFPLTKHLTEKQGDRIGTADLFA
jgi:hypothetical protein